MIVCFIDIGGIVDHHCLNFLLPLVSNLTQKNNRQFLTLPITNEKIKPLKLPN